MSASPTPAAAAGARRGPRGQYAGKTADARQRERKARFVAAAITLFGEQGFADTSIDALCREAGLTKRYFYQAFDSREALLVSAFHAVSRDMLNAIAQGTAPHLNDPRALVRHGLQHTFGFVEQNPAKARLMMIEAMSVRPQLGRVFVDSYDGFVTLLLGFTKPFLPPGAPGDEILAVMARGAIGAIIHLSQGWIATDFRQPLEELVEGMELILGGMGHELGVPGWREAR